MKRIFKIIGVLLIVYFFLAYAFPKFIAIPFAAWNSQQVWKEYENNLTVTRGSTEELKKIIDKNLNGKSELNPKIALESIIELYNNTKNEVVVSNEKPIDIYVIYGTDHWKEDAETFEIAFAHQKVDKKNANLYEYRIDMVYDSSDFKEIQEFNVRFDSTLGIDEFKKAVTKSIGFQKALNIKPKKIEIVKEQI